MNYLIFSICYGIFLGKNQVKTALLLESESGAHVVESLGNQAVLTGNPQSAATLADMVDELSNSDIQQVCLMIFFF